jgi:UDP-GlcNAc:undecaprenyl-phosphate GlcNAc-1-phosphate transferase
LMDTLRVTLLRIYKGRSPFDPDVNHVHHVLLKKGLSHIRITGTLSVAAIGFILLAYVLLPLGITFVIFSIIALATAMISYTTWSGKKRSTYTGAPKMPAGHNKKTSRFFTRVSVSDPEINN